MSPVTPTAAGRQAAQAWVLAFAHGWLAPASADAFADHFQPWFHPHVRLRQPLLPTLLGHQAFRERFARPLFALIPDLDGQMERFAIGADCAYVELTLRGTLGGRPIAWRACDRVTLRDGLVVERESYFDPTPLLRALLTPPASLAGARPHTAATATSSTEHDGSMRRCCGSTAGPADNQPDPGG